MARMFDSTTTASAIGLGRQVHHRTAEGNPRRIRTLLRMDRSSERPVNDAGEQDGSQGGVCHG